MNRVFDSYFSGEMNLDDVVPLTLRAGGSRLLAVEAIFAQYDREEEEVLLQRHQEQTEVA